MTAVRPTPGGKTIGPIIATPRVAVHLAIIDPQLEAIPVQLDFMHPLIGLRWCISRFGKARLNEARKRRALRCLAIAYEEQCRIVELLGVLLL
jgi:hypothetical protein